MKNRTNNPENNMMSDNASNFQKYCLAVDVRNSVPMIKVVINSCFGGFSFSEAAQKRLIEAGMDPEEIGYGGRGLPRSDPRLVQVVEDMGEAADGECARLRIVEVPADVKWHVVEYDGQEHVAEDHRTWG